MLGIRDAAISRFDAKGIAGRVQVEIHNPNNYRIRLKDPDVDLYANDVLLGKAMLDSTVVLDRNSTRTYTVPLHATLQEGGQGALLPVLLTTMLGGRVKLGVKGTAVGQVGLLRKRFPFEAEYMVEPGER